MSKMSYEDICVLVAIIKKLDNEEAVTLFCIIEQLLRSSSESSGITG